MRKNEDYIVNCGGIVPEAELSGVGCETGEAAVGPDGRDRVWVHSSERCCDEDGEITILQNGRASATAAAEAVSESGNEDTELVFIIDRSGSMSGFEVDTIGGFNSMIERQKKDSSGKVYVTTVLFDNVVETLHDRLPIDEVGVLTEREYYARGSTALLDAVGETVRHIEKIHRYARREDVPKNTIVVVTTDGYENASREYTRSAVKKLIEAKTEAGWEFVFVGANIDAITEAATIGIRQDRAANYRQDSDGICACYESLGDFVQMRRHAAASTDVGGEWKREE